MASNVLTKVSAIVFDWSGVLSDDRRVVHRCNDEMLARRGLSRVTYEEWLRNSQASVHEVLRNAGIEEDATAVSREYEELLVSFKGNGLGPEVYPNALEVLTCLHERGNRTVVISSHPPAHLEAEAEAYGLAPFISSLNGGVGDKSVALKRLKDTRPGQMAYVGDTVFDIRAARKAGLVSVGITSGYHDRARLATENPDVLVSSLTELASMVI